MKSPKYQHGLEPLPRFSLAWIAMATLCLSVGAALLRILPGVGALSIGILATSLIRTLCLPRKLDAPVTFKSDLLRLANSIGFVIAAMLCCGYFSVLVYAGLALAINDPMAGMFISLVSRAAQLLFAIAYFIWVRRQRFDLGDVGFAFAAPPFMASFALGLAVSSGLRINGGMLLFFGPTLAMSQFFGMIIGLILSLISIRRAPRLLGCLAVGVNLSILPFIIPWWEYLADYSDVLSVVVELFLLSLRLLGPVLGIALFFLLRWRDSNRASPVDVIVPTHQEKNSDNHTDSDPVLEVVSPPPKKAPPPKRKRSRRKIAIILGVIALIGASGGLAAWWLMPTDPPSIVVERPDRVFHYHAGEVNAVAFSHNARRLISGSRDKTIVSWNFETNQKVATMKHEDIVFCLDISPNGRTIASGGGNDLYLWRSGGGHLARMSGHESVIRDVAYSPNNQRIATAGHDRTVRIWHFDQRRLLHTCETGNIATAVTFSPESDVLVSGSLGNEISFWKVADGSLIKTLPASGQIAAIDYSRKGDLIAAASFDGVVEVWDTSTDKRRRLTRFEEPAIDVEFSWRGDYLFCASTNGTIKIYDAATLEILNVYEDVSNGGNMQCIALPLGPDRIATGGTRNVNFFRISTKKSAYKDLPEL